MEAKIIFEILYDEDEFHSKYEVIVYGVRGPHGFCGGDFIKFNCETIEEAIESFKDFPIDSVLLEAL